MTCVVNSRGTYAFPSSSSELLNAIEDVSALTRRLGTFESMDGLELLLKHTRL